MKGEQWEEFLTKDYPTDREWTKAENSARNWCSCAVGALVLGNDVIKDPLNELSDSQLSKINSYVFSRIVDTKHKNLGSSFCDRIYHRNLKEARKIWNEIHKKKGDKK